MTTNKGRFITFEGIDGSGKTTQIARLKQHIEANGIRCYDTLEPTSGPIGSTIRQCLTGRTKMDEQTLAALFAADRLDHLLNEIDGLCHKIDSGIAVICDRYILSSYAYQSVRVPLERVMELNHMACDILRPDCHIFIDVDPEVSMERMKKGRFHAELFETKNRLTEVRNRYFELFDMLKETESIIIINGNQTVEQIESDIWDSVSHLF